MKLIFSLLLLTVVVAKAADVKLAWNSSTSLDVTSYRVSWGDATGKYTNSVPVLSGNSITISNLAPGARYFFAAKAQTVTGIQSAFSNEIWYDTPSPPVLPPTNNVDRVVVERRLSGTGWWLPVATNYFTSTNKVRNYRTQQGTYR